MIRIFKGLLSTFLALILLITILPAGLIKAAAEVQASSSPVTGDTITFGSYPQTEVKDSALIDSLNSCTLSADNTATYGGSKYIRVYFTRYTPFYYDYPSYEVYSFQDDNGYYINTVYWFKYEPLQWRVLSNTNGELFVMADKILDSRAYNEFQADVTWESCTMRSWLNNDFYNTAFNSTQRTKIKTSTVVNADNPWNGTEGGDNTNDKLFLLSYSEVINPAYGFSSSTNYDTAREAKGTDYSRSQGLYVDTGSSYLENSYWWLRSPGYDPYCAGIVLDYGTVYYSYGSDVRDSGIGARPAFKINLSSDIFTSTITFDANGGTGGTGGVMTCGDPLMPPNVERAGYIFAGWSPEVPAIVPKADATFVAQWTANTYTIIYNGNGSTGGSTASSTHTYAAAKALTANGFTKTGYAFAGWASSADGNVIYSDGQIASNLSETNGAAVNLYAKWTDVSLSTLTFDANGGTGGISTTLIRGTAFTAPTVTRTGYSFAGWSPAVPTTVPETDTTYKAQWTANNYTVIFNLNANGGSVSPTTSTVTYDSTYGEGTGGFPIPISPGVAFVGWYTGVGGGTQILSSNIVNITEAQTLYAHWRKLSYTIVYDGNGSTGGSTTSSTHTYKVTKALTANGFTKSGYTFAGWATSPDGAVVYSNNQMVMNLADTDGATVTLYAKWTVNSYTITFDADGGTGGSVTSMQYGAPLTVPAVARTGYTFVCWSPSVPATVPAKDTTYAALWIKQQGVDSVAFAGLYFGGFAPLTIKVFGKPDKIQFVSSATAATNTYDRRTSTRIVSIQGYDKDGNKVDTPSTDIAYEIWTINVKLAAGDYTARAKYLTAWNVPGDDIPFTVVYFDKPSASFEVNKTQFSRGDSVVFTAITNMDITKIQLVDGSGSTWTYALATANVVDNPAAGSRTWTVTRIDVPAGFYSWTLLTKKGTVWTNTGLSVSYMVV